MPNVSRNSPSAKKTLVTWCPSASDAVVARLRISTGGACRNIAVTPSSFTSGQKPLAENRLVPSTSAPPVSPPITP